MLLCARQGRAPNALAELHAKTAHKRVTMRIALLLNKAFYTPGESVLATVQVRVRLDSACDLVDRVLTRSGDAAQVVNEATDDQAPRVARVTELTFRASGTERTDPSWISSLFRKELKTEAVENRVGHAEGSKNANAAWAVLKLRLPCVQRGIRTIFTTEAAALISDAQLAVGAARQFQLRWDPMQLLRMGGQ